MFINKMTANPPHSVIWGIAVERLPLQLNSVTFFSFAYPYTVQGFGGYDGAIFEGIRCGGGVIASLRLGTVRTRSNRLDHQEGVCGDQRAIQRSPCWNLRARCQCEELFWICGRQWKWAHLLVRSPPLKTLGARMRQASCCLLEARELLRSHFVEERLSITIIPVFNWTKKHLDPRLSKTNIRAIGGSSKLEMKIQRR